MQNININGRGSFQGGEYDSVVINGASRCEESFVCRELQVNGALHANHVTAEELNVNGSLTANDEVIAGNANIDGTMSATSNMRTDHLDVDGNLSIHGTLTAGNTEVNGRLKCENTADVGNLDCDGLAKFCNGLSAKEIKVDGLLNVTGNIEAESILTKGRVTCTAQMSADTIQLHGMVSADEIVGDHIEIKYKDISGIAASLMNSIFGSKLVNDAKCANLIEATTIELTGVCAGVVSGENVTIGENCRIDRLDCTGAYTIHPGSTVRLLNGEPYMN